MSGHNKWTQIKHQKGAVDAKRSKLFSMLSRQITIEAKQAAGDRHHPNLRKAIERARAANMPSDNIERAVEKGLGTRDEGLVEVIYEAYGPGGAALIITGITDNKNRTSQELKHLLSEHGGSLAAPGAALWAFSKIENEHGVAWQAKVTVPLSEMETETLVKLMAALEDHADVKSIFTNT